MTSGKARRTVHAFVAGSLVTTGLLMLPATPAQASDSVAPGTAETPGAATDARRRATLDGGHASGLSTAGGGTHVPGEVLVRYAPGSRAASRAAARSAVDAKLVRTLPRGLELLKVRGGVGKAVAALERRPDVRYAEPNYVYTTSALPDDPRLPEQWGLHNVGRPVYGEPGTGAPDIWASQAWDRETGDAAITVAVVDSGVDLDHPDLAENLWRSSTETLNGVDDDGNGYVDDVQGWDWAEGDNDADDPNGHGTHVAGTVGAVGNNGVGGAGVAWDVSLMPLRVTDAAGRGTSADIVQAFEYARAQGVDVVNVSLSGFEHSQAMADSIAAASDTLFVTAAGNEGRDNDVTPTYPCSLPSENLVCVAASNHHDSLPTFSNYGSTSVDLAAPGYGILSTVPPRAPVWSDDFESGWTERWTTGGTRRWGLESDPEGSYVSDSPGGNYAANADSRLRTRTPLDLSGRRGCTVGYWLYLETQPHKDWFTVEASTDGTDWATVAEWTGSTEGYWYSMQESLADFDGADSVHLRLRLTSDGSVQYDGAGIDDVEVSCVGDSYSGDEYEPFDGTSMAAPHVAGTAALLFSAVPGTTAGAVKDALLDGVDEGHWFEGKVSTGGRLNANESLKLLQPTMTFIRPTTWEVENKGTATLTVVRGGETGVPVTVDYASGGGTAVAGEDYEPVSGTLSFAAGQTTATFTVPLIDNDVYEGDMTLYFRLLNPTGSAVLGVQDSVKLTIRDDEIPPQLSFDTTRYSVPEDGESVTITVRRTGDMTRDVEVDYGTLGVTADERLDFTPTEGTLSFPAGRTEATFTVPIVDDETYEGDETVALRLFLPTNDAETVAPSYATLTITENDPEPAVVGFARIRRYVREDAGTVNLLVTRTGNTDLPAKVSYRRTSGSATPGTDVTIDPGTLDFAPGEKTKTITLTVTDDRAQESAENVVLTLTSEDPATEIGSTRSTNLIIRHSDQRPDAWISKFKRSRYAGNDVYNRTGRLQTRVSRARRTQVRTFYVRVYNDGTTANTFRVKGTASPAGSRVRYLAGSNNITRAMRSDAGWRIRLRPGRFRLVTVRVKVLRGAAFGSRKRVKVRATWNGDSTRGDTARAVVKVVR